MVNYELCKLQQVFEMSKLEEFQRNLLKVTKEYRKFKEQISEPSLQATDKEVSDPDWMRSQGFVPPEDLEASIKAADEQNRALASAEKSGFPTYQHQGQTFQVLNPSYSKGGTTSQPSSLTPQQVQKIAGTNIRSASGEPVTAGSYMLRPNQAGAASGPMEGNSYRKLINIVESANKSCPVATYDIDVNLKNRQKAIDEYHYGPANPDKPENYWRDLAAIWKIKEATAKTMKCENCGAFDVSDDMRKCIEDGIRGDDNKIADARAPIDLADLGYCTFLKFKCAGSRSCSAWITGGPIVKD